MLKYEDLTGEQQKLYSRLDNAIRGKQDIACILKKASREDLLAVLNAQNGSDFVMLNKAICNHYQKGIKDILDVAKEKGILKVVLTTVNVVEYCIKGFIPTTPLALSCDHRNIEAIEAIVGAAKEEGILKEVLNDIGRDGLKSIKSVYKETKDRDILNEIYQIEKSRAVNKAMKVGSVCSVITALAVGGGCFAAGVALPMLALIGIAVVAALVTGLVAGGITYKMSMPSSEVPYERLDSVDTKQGVSSGRDATA